MRFFPPKTAVPLLRDKKLREELHRYIGGILKERDCEPIITGGTEDHVHGLFALSRTRAVAEIIKEIKRSSTRWLKNKGLDDFAWQSGYGIFSIGFSQMGDVRDYVAGQEEHHRKISFQDEFRKLLQRYEIEFDERYVWD
jgi:putative transposase